MREIANRVEAEVKGEDGERMKRKGRGRSREGRERWGSEAFMCMIVRPMCV